MFFASRKKDISKKNQPKQKSKLNFQKRWTILQNGVNKLIEFLDNFSSGKAKKPYNHEEYSVLYKTVYDLCTQKVDIAKIQGGPTTVLYEKYKECIHNYLKERVVVSLKSLEKNETLLNEAVRRWRDHQIVVKWMQKLFKYLDRYYTKHNNRDNLKDVGLKIYQKCVYGSVKKDMSTALLKKIYQERQKESIDRSVMKDGINLFIEMGLGSLDQYTADFEEPLLDETTEYYKTQSSKWISQDSAPDYMKKAEDRLREEQERSKSYLHPSTESNLINKVEFELVSHHATRLLEMENSGFIPLLKDLRKDDLSRMFRLFKRVDNLKPMSEHLKEFITEEGLQILNSHRSKVTIDFNAYISQLLALHDKYSNLVTIQFEKHQFFLEALRDAFTNFVNKDLVNQKTKKKTSTAELLSTYCDMILKATDKKTESELEEVLENIVRLFGYISDKDMFQEFYRRQLCKRLLVSSKTNLEYEKSLIQKLKVRCGASFTSKLEGMIKDKTVSEELQNQFSTYLNDKKVALPCDFVPKVLTTGFWPQFKIDQLTIPEVLSNCISKFKNFYDSKTESRTLKWVHSFGTVHILARYANGNKDLQMSTYQACILLLFNEENKKISTKNIIKTLTLPHDDVKRNLLSLCVTKNAKILNKTGNLKSVQPNDDFSVNTDFKSKNRRIKVPNLVLVISEKEKKDINKTTQEDRKHAIEAAIVRIMKSRKEMKHHMLVLETSKQLMQHFKPDPKIIKSRIEDLIQRDYLERDENVSDLYRYLA